MTESNPEDVHIFKNLRKLINTVDELRDAGLDKIVQLPRICVIGTQSSGKSSVLEAIMGLDILPRGDGTVTRRPIELRLVHLSESSHSINEGWVFFEGDPTKYTNFDRVREQIISLTDSKAGSKSGIISEPIVMTVYATKCPDLTLIDLPGITRVPIAGSDQNDDIERVTRDIALQYAKDSRTIILAVLAANVDAGTSDALLLARLVDPMGVRTIGVVTKIDLLDKEDTDAIKLLNGQVVQLRLGFTGMVCRSRSNMLAGVSLTKSIEEGNRYFMNHPLYSRLSAGSVGSVALIDKLTTILFRHIKQFLPQITNEINMRIANIRSRLRVIGEVVPDGFQDRRFLVSKLLNEYIRTLNNALCGKRSRRIDPTGGVIIIGSTKIRDIFCDLLSQFVDSDITQDTSDEDIDLTLQECEGTGLPGFPSQESFENLLYPFLARLPPPVMDALDCVSQALEELSNSCLAAVFVRFPKLINRVRLIASEMLMSECGITRTRIEDFVTAMTSCVFTNDKSYLKNHANMINTSKVGDENTKKDGGGQATQPTTVADTANDVKSRVEHTIKSVGAWIGVKKKTRNSKAILDEMRSRLNSYFSIIVREIRQAVPVMILHFFINSFVERLGFELQNTLNDPDINNSDFLSEAPAIFLERDSILKQLSILEKARKVLQVDQTIAKFLTCSIDETYDTDLQNTCNYSTKTPVPASSRSIKDEPVEYPSLSTGSSSSQGSFPPSFGRTATQLDPVTQTFNPLDATKKVSLFGLPTKGLFD